MVILSIQVSLPEGNNVNLFHIGLLDVTAKKMYEIQIMI